MRSLLRNCFFLFLIAAQSAGWLGCTPDANPAHPQLPLTIHYAVESPDTGALGLVNTYYADAMAYTLYDSVHYSMRRSNLMGGAKEWYDGENLYLRTEQGPFCTCVHLKGELLDVWESDDWISELTATEQSGQALGFSTQAYFAVDQMNDTTRIELTHDLPNGWIMSRHLPGMPLRYSYKLRGAEVMYRADSVSTTTGRFRPEVFDSACVRQPPAGFIGFSPNDTLNWEGNHVWAFGSLTDMNQQPLNGEVLVQRGTSGENFASMRIEQGMFDLQLLPGEFYLLDFSAEGMAHQILVIDNTKMPDDGRSYSLPLEIELFNPASPEVADYLQTKPFGVAAYNADSTNIIFDFEYTRAVRLEVQRMEIEAEIGVEPESGRP